MTFLRSKAFKIFIAIFILLLLVRIALPFALVPYLNQVLSSVEGYDAKVKSVSLSFLRLSATAHDLKVMDKSIKQELLTVSSTETRILWSQLLKGQILVSATINKPKFRIALDEKVLSQLAIQTVDVASIFNWLREIRKMYPVAIDAIHINDGQATLVDRWKPLKPLTVQVSNIDIDATNLTNRLKTAEHLFAPIRMEATVAKGTLTINADTHPEIEKAPDFDMRLSLESIQLVAFNPFFKEYGNFDFEKGTVSLTGKLKSKNGLVNGSVKPIAKDIKIVDTPQQQTQKSFFANLWEKVLQTTADTAKKENTDKIETVIPITGRIDSANVGMTMALAGIFRSSLLGAIEPSVREKK